MKRVLVIMLLVLTASCSAGPPTSATSTSPAAGLPPENPGPGDHSTAFLEEGEVRRYLVHAPASYTPEKQYPLVLVFHGQPGSPEAMVDQTLMNVVADANDFLVVYPRNMFRTGTVAALLDHFVPTWNVDPRRIHAAGFSRGGTLVYQLAAAMPERFGSVAPVAASHTTGASLSHPLSLITFQGSHDDLSGLWESTNVSWDAAADCSDESVTDTFLANGPASVSSKTCANGTEHVVYSVSGMGHTWPAGGSELIWEFFAQHPLP